MKKTMSTEQTDKLAEQLTQEYGSKTFFKKMPRAIAELVDTRIFRSDTASYRITILSMRPASWGHLITISVRFQLCIVDADGHDTDEEDLITAITFTYTIPRFQSTKHACTMIDEHIRMRVQQMTDTTLR